ncbi:MAG: hypothetical protein AAGF58_09945 [Pseudomonadota bacterium]
MSKKRGAAIAISALACIMVTVTSCATSGPESNDYCLLTDFIWLSPEDSASTADQVIIHNERREAVCGSG